MAYGNLDYMKKKDSESTKPYKETVEFDFNNK